jgi:hypothetical protein
MARSLASASYRLSGSGKTWDSNEGNSGINDVTGEAKSKFSLEGV